MKSSMEFLGVINDNKIYKYLIESDNNMKFCFLNYGGIITDLITPDKYGNYENIVIKFDDFRDYEVNKPSFGAIIGRVAGRIKNAEFKLNGENYFLEKNDGNNCLHGGFIGFHHRIWDVVECPNEDGISFKLLYVDEDGEGGFPGTIHMEVTYTFTKEGELIINYKGTSDKDTILNPTNHTYFNLSGNAKNTIENHYLKIKSDRFIELNDELIPTGKLLNVENTTFDFKKYNLISRGIKSDDPQNIIAGNGYDHGFILNKNINSEISDIAVYDPVSGRELKVETDSKAVVVYTSNQMDDSFKVNNQNSKQYMGICLETQIEPDAINNENFSDCVLKKSEIFSSTTKFTFKVNKS